MIWFALLTGVIIGTIDETLKQVQGGLLKQVQGDSMMKTLKYDKERIND